VTVSEFLTFVVLLGAAVASFGVITRTLLRQLDRRIDDKLESVKDELKPNGGPSLRDDVAAIRASVDAATTQVVATGDVATERHAENVRRLAALERSHHGIRRTVLWLLDAHRRTDLPNLPSHAAHELAAATNELRLVEDEYRWQAGRNRPDEPAQ